MVKIPVRIPVKIQEQLENFPFSLEEFKTFGTVKKTDGFSGKAYSTAHLFQLNDTMGAEMQKELPEGYVAYNPDGANNKYSLYKRFMQIGNRDIFIDRIHDVWYKLPEATDQYELDTKTIANECGVILPDDFELPIIKATIYEVAKFKRTVVSAYPLPLVVEEVNFEEAKRLCSIYGEDILLIFRSAAQKGEDDDADSEVAQDFDNLTRFVQADSEIASLQEPKMGAGQHESEEEINYRNGATTLTRESCSNALMHTWMSIHSNGATGDFYRMKDKDGTWFHSSVYMDVIVMPYVQDDGAFLAFSDAIDNVIEVTYGKGVPGKNLVEGNATYPVINTHRNANGEIKVNPVSFEVVSQQDQQIIKSIASGVHFLERKGVPREPVEDLGKNPKFCVDNESKTGVISKTRNIRYVSLVQYRCFLPAQHARATDTITLFEVVETPEVKTITQGKSVGEMCAVGELYRVKDLHDLVTGNHKGKILLVKEAYSDLLMTIKHGVKAWLLIPEAFKSHASLNGDGEVCQTHGVDANAFANIEDGTTITVLFGDVYVGDHSHCFIESTESIKELDDLTLTKIAFVDAMPTASRRRKMFVFARLGKAIGNNLLRPEAVEINADVPTYFYWKYFMNIDVTTSEGERVKQYIINAMETYSVEKPEDAYELRMAGLIMPHAAFYEYFGTSNDIRILGFRNDESPTPHLKNVLFPHEPNPIMGFNGVAMYATEWGWSVAVASIRILKRMEDEYELDNSSIFIPNATGMEYIVKITEMAIQEGLDITKRGIKIMVENAKMMRGRFIYKEQKLLLDGELDQWKLIAPSLIDYRAQLKESLGKPVEFTMSFGFNDFGNSYTGGDTRHLKMPDRGYLGDNHTTEEIEDFMDLCAKYDIACYSCGLPEWGLQVSMMKKRAASIGLPVGLKMVKAINQLSKVEKLLLN